MSFKTALVSGSMAAVVLSAALASQAEAQCWLCFVAGDQSWCVPSGNPHAGYVGCTTINDGGLLKCVLSGAPCFITVLDDLDADGTKAPNLAGAFSAPLSVDTSDGVTRSLDCKGRVTGRQFGADRLVELEETLEVLHL